MPDKPTATNGGYFAIPGWTVVSLRGEDASRFAQAQFMSDVATLAAGHWHWSGWLTPKGRVLALFALLRLDGGTLLALLPDADPAQFAAALSRFVFRSKAKIAVEPGLHVLGAFRAPDAARGPASADLGAASGIELDLGAEGGTRALRIAPEAVPGESTLAARWMAFDLAHGLPRLDTSQGDRWTPQQLSLERLRAFSVKKGCYPGQEIVARTHFLGQAKRGLMRLAGPSMHAGSDVLPVDPPAGVAGPPRAIGQVVCASEGEALAVMPLDAGDGPFNVAGQACLRLPLRDGLAR